MTYTMDSPTSGQPKPAAVIVRSSRVNVSVVCAAASGAFPGSTPSMPERNSRGPDADRPS